MKTDEDPNSNNNIKWVLFWFFVDNYQICHDLINVYILHLMPCSTRTHYFNQIVLLQTIKKIKSIMSSIQFFFYIR